MKICRTCKQEKPLNEFYKYAHTADHYWSQCKECAKKIARQRYEQLSPEEKSILNHRKTIRYKSRRKQYNKKYYWLNRKHLLVESKKWRDANPEKQRVFSRTKYHKNKSDSIYKLNKVIPSMVRYSLKRRKLCKNGYRWEELVGYATEELKRHLEKQFVVGMHWGNYGDWEIDHIIPISFFEYESPNDVEFKMCWRLENLQPLWKAENRKKFNKLVRVA